MVALYNCAMTDKCEDDLHPQPPLFQEQKEELAVLKERFSALALHLPEDEFPIDLLAVYPETSQFQEL